jgi:hypothetical protein
MSRSRAAAVFAALVTMMAMVAGVLVSTSAAASASPKLHPYPPPPPALVVNHGWVRQHSTVRVTGRRYGHRERVFVIIVYPGHHVTKTVARTDHSGRFSVRLRLTRAGRVVIRATGTRSGKSASVVVIVRRSHGHGRPFQPAAFTTGLDTTASATPPTDDDRGLAIAGLGALALLSGALVTTQVTRRRRKVHAG